MATYYGNTTLVIDVRLHKEPLRSKRSARQPALCQQNGSRTGTAPAMKAPVFMAGVHRHSTRRSDNLIFKFLHRQNVAQTALYIF